MSDEKMEFVPSGEMTRTDRLERDIATLQAEFAKFHQKDGEMNARQKFFFTLFAAGVILLWLVLYGTQL